MATNPAFSQYHTQRFSFIGSPQQRDGSHLKDQRFLNMYPELIKSNLTEGKKYYLKKRPGTTNPVQVGHADEPGRGCYYWGGLYYVCVGSELYRTSGGGGFSPLIALSTSGGPVGFCEYRDDTQDLLFFCDGNNAYTIAPGLAGGVVVVTDINLPRPHIPAPQFLDGYIFLAHAGTQIVCNSKLQDPLTWPADGFIDVEMFPDTLQTLTKSNNYLCAVGMQSCEFLYDNANSTGSPLQRNAPAVAQFGTPAPLSVCQTEKEVILIGATGNGGRTVWVIDGFQPTEIGTEPIRQALDFEGPTIASASGFVIQCAGHKWYLMNLYAAGRTFVYDFEEKMWHEWMGGATQSVFPYIFATDAGNGQPFLLGLNGMTASLDSGTFLDIGATIYCSITTTKIDFDSVERKRIFRLSMVGDGPSNNQNVPINVSWSDDDYNTFTTPRTLNLSGGYSTITQLGYTRRRAFRFEYSQPYMLRLESFELDITQEVRR